MDSGLLLVAILALPLLGAAAVMRMRTAASLSVAATVATADLVLGALLAARIPLSGGGPWIPDLGLSLRLGLDGLNLPLVLLTPLLAALALLLTPRNLERPGEYAGWMLLLAGCIQGVFLADNLGLFYVFWEVMLLPAWILLGRWGGERGRRAAVKLLLYTLAGSLVMLLGVVYLAFVASAPTPDLDFAHLAGLPLDPGTQLGLLALFAVGFSVKAGLFPIHGWLPDTYEAAPAPVTAVVSGAMSKTGVYGFFKVGMLLFPAGMEAAAPALGTLAVATILYGAACALGAGSFRRILAYSSLSHMGIMLLGVASLRTAGFQGAALQMFNHGVATGGLFLAAGLLEDRRLPSALSRLGGLAREMPRAAAALMILALASLGLPGLNSFPGELLVLLGAFQASPAWAVLGSLGVLLAGWYMLRAYQGAMHGPAGPALELGPEDLRSCELVGLLPLLALVVVLGVAPAILVDPATPVLEMLLSGGAA